MNRLKANSLIASPLCLAVAVAAVTACSKPTSKQSQNSQPHVEDSPVQVAAKPAANNQDKRLLSQCPKAQVGQVIQFCGADHPSDTLRIDCEQPVKSLCPLLGLPRLRVLTLNKNIPSLAPLVALAELRKLDLRGGSADAPVSLTPLSALTLEFLSIENAQVESLRPVTSTESLFLENVDVDLRPVSTMARLRNLTIRGSKSVSLSLLRELERLRELDLRNSTLADTEALLIIGARLTLLDLSATNIADLSKLARANRLVVLHLEDTLVADLSQLVVMKNLERLNLRNTKISNVAPISALEQLLMLDLGGTAVSDLAPLAGLSKLSHLQLDRTPITDLRPLSALTSLVLLNVSDTTIKSVEPLRALPRLQQLSVENTAIPKRDVNKLLNHR